MERTDGELAIGGAEADASAGSVSVSVRLAAANDEMAEYLRSRNTKLLGDVLYTSSNLMHNSFAMSDRWN